MGRETVILFTRNGLGNAPEELQRVPQSISSVFSHRRKISRGNCCSTARGSNLACGDSPVPEALNWISSGRDELSCAELVSDYSGLDKVAGNRQGMRTSFASCKEMQAKIVSV